MVRLQSTALGKRMDAISGYDEMIDHPHINQRQRRFEACS
jgi:hypothetical protein